MTLKIKIIAAALGVMLLATGIFYVKNLRADNARLAQETAMYQAQAAAMRMELNANRAALVAREESRQKLEAETLKLKTELEDLYEKDAEAQTWSADYIPNAVLKCLR